MGEDYYSYINKFFKKFAPFYDLITLPVLPVRAKVVELTGAKKGSKILDVCTGTGAQAFAFGRRGYEVVGIDLSEDMLKVAERKNGYENVSFGIADASVMPFGDKHFDVSCISFGLHDMPHEIREKVLDEMRRVSKKIVVIDYNIPQNRIHRWFQVFFISLYESKYFKDFARQNFKRLLHQHNLKIKKEIHILLDAFGIFICEVAN
ncbi:MAG TPA: methyltransferase domain-containing protein [Anaerolineae bacterium]|nr:methyltransferase domain-containing protein [Anaerolineae bacterium]